MPRRRHQLVLTLVNSSVTVNKSFLPTTVAVGGTSTMSIQIRNNNAGAIALTGVGFTDSLPAGMVVANPPVPTTGACGAPVVIRRERRRHGRCCRARSVARECDMHA